MKVVPIMHAIQQADDGSLAPRVPRTVRELIEAVSYTTEPESPRAMFHCMLGPPRAYMEIPLGPTFRPEEYGRFQGPQVLRGVFQTLLFGARARRADAEPALVARMHDVFVAARDAWHAAHGKDIPLLFWRQLPHVEEWPKVDGQDWLTTIRCRVWIPGVSLPAFVVGTTEMEYVT